MVITKPAASVFNCECGNVFLVLFLLPTRRNITVLQMFGFIDVQKIGKVGFKQVNFHFCMCILLFVPFKCAPLSCLNEWHRSSSLVKCSHVGTKAGGWRAQVFILNFLRNLQGNIVFLKLRIPSMLSLSNHECSRVNLEDLLFG